MLAKIEEYLKTKQFQTRSGCKAYRLWLKRLYEREGEYPAQDKINNFMIWVQERYAPKTLEFCSAILSNFSRENDLHWKVKVRRQRANSYQPIDEETHKEILKLCPIYEYKYLQRHLVVRMLHETGCRISELLSLNVSDIISEPSAEIQTRKTTNTRRIFWSHETHRLLLDKYMPLRQEIMRSEALFLGIYNSGEYSDRLNRRAVERWYRYFSKKLGTRVVPHGERHGKAHHILDCGGNLADVQNILGHTNPASSFKYLGYGGKEMEKRASKFL